LVRLEKVDDEVGDVVKRLIRKGYVQVSYVNLAITPTQALVEVLEPRVIGMLRPKFDKCRVISRENRMNEPSTMLTD
jgi:hypothetical protein